MNRTVPAVIVAAAIGYFVGSIRSSEPVAYAQAAPAAPAAQQETLPFGFNRPGTPAQAPDAPPQTVYWSWDDIRKLHKDVADRVSKEAAPHAGLYPGGNIGRVRTRVFSMSLIYRAHREQPVESITKVSSVWDDAEQHAGVYDFYIITGGSGEMVVGGKIANRQNLMEANLGPVPGEYRGQPIIGGQSYKVKEGDWLVIPPDAPHQAKPDAGGLSYMIMKLNTGMYPWNLIR